MSRLFFVAVIPPAGICDIITAIKREIASVYGSQHVLRLVPHITLKAPFSAEPGAAQEWFQMIPLLVDAFEQQLKNFRCFPNKRNPVIYIEPVMNPALAALQQNILDSFSDYFPDMSVSNNEKQFHPHVTIAYRDLPYDKFADAWAEYRGRKFEAQFTVDKIYLMQHDQRQWNIVSERSLNKSG